MNLEAQANPQELPGGNEKQPTDSTVSTDSSGLDFFAHNIPANLPLLPNGQKMHIPPPSFIHNEGRVEAFTPKQNITVSFPVRDFQINPQGILQGGILSAFFDDTFGPLFFTTLQKPFTTIDLDVNFLRAAAPGERVRIVAEITGRGRRMISGTARAYNGKGKLMATSSTNCLIL